MLEKEEIGHRLQEFTNTLGAVDAAIGTPNVTLAKQMINAGSESWAKAAAMAVVACNANSHNALMNTAPEDVRETPVLQYDLEKQSGFDMAFRSNIN